MTALHEEIFRSQTEELSFDLPGKVPDDLRGRALRIGGGHMAVGADAFHFLDGHGLVAEVGFDGGAARFRCRHVRTTLLAEELAAGKQKGRRLFTNLPGRLRNLFKIKLANPANHDLYQWGGRLMTALDPGHYALDAASLETIGEERWAGAAPAGHLMSPMQRIDPELDRLVGYVVKPGIGKPDEITFVELDRSFATVRSAGCKLAAGPQPIHDLAISKRFFMVLELPAKLAVMPGLLGGKALYEALRWKGTPTLLLVPRAGGEPIRVTLPGPTMTIFHFINVYDDGDKLVVDCVGYDGKVEFSMFATQALAERDYGGRKLNPPGPNLLRFTVDPAARTAQVRSLSGERGELPEIAPWVHGRPYRYAYLSAPGKQDGLEPDPNAFAWFHGLLKLDVTSGATELWPGDATVFCSQPAFAPRPGATEEDDGYLIAWLHDGVLKTVTVAVWDARALAAGPIARLPVGKHLPGPSHALWVPS